MQELTNIGQRIAILVQHYAHGKNTEFASLVGTSEGNIRGYIKGVLPKSDVLGRIVTSCDNLSASWLLTGEGEMIISNEKKQNNNEYTALITLIKEKDQKLLQLSEQIGELKAEIKNLQNIVDNAQSTTHAAVG